MAELKNTGIVAESTASKIMSKDYRYACITAYNRLEPNPRTLNFDRSLKAEVRDALWMLTRQWQFGEFQGEDAGSPVAAHILGGHVSMNKVGFPGENISPYDENVPLETVVERETLGENLFFALQIARYFKKILKAKAVDTHPDKFIGQYPINYPIADRDYEAQQMLLAARKGKLFDGCRLYADITEIDPGEGQTRYTKWINSDQNDDILADEKTKLQESAVALQEWFQRNYSQPEKKEASAWKPEQLEYTFSVWPDGQKDQKCLVSDQYPGGRLDWFSFDLESPAASLNEQVSSFIPAPVKFRGMPNPRFWSMEENQTDFGKIDTSTTGLLHMMFAEFGLVYSNDWFMLPYPLPLNTLCKITDIVITDVFGQHFLIRPAGKGQESDWQRWTMFHQTDRTNSDSTANYLYLPPALAHVQEGAPLEQVNFLRDEMANMVWAVENIVPSQSGKGVSGKELALKEKKQSEFKPAGDAKTRYVLGTTVPDNWIPFIPVLKKGSVAEIRLQRAKMPGSQGPAGVLLKEKQPAYFINEEEVPRAGVIVQRNFQRARWVNGKTYLWIGRYKEASRGEGWSNLKFDQIEQF